MGRTPFLCGLGSLRCGEDVTDDKRFIHTLKNLFKCGNVTEMPRSIIDWLFIRYQEN
jgi:hypothetical protein